GKTAAERKPDARHGLGVVHQTICRRGESASSSHIITAAGKPESMDGLQTLTDIYSNREAIVNRRDSAGALTRISKLVSANGGVMEFSLPGRRSWRPSRLDARNAVLLPASNQTGGKSNDDLETPTGAGAGPGHR